MIIPDQERDSFEQLFKIIYRDNDLASDLSFMILECLHVWDDLYDGDSVTSSDGNKAFLNAMVKIPTHPLSRNIPHLPYMIQSIYLQWQAANKMEERKKGFEKSFMLRAAVYQFFIDLSSYLHGIEHAESISVLVWDWYGETAKDIKEEFTCQHQ